MSLLLAVWWQSVNKYAPKEKRPQTCLRAALAGFVALIETIRAKRKRVLRRVYNASLFNSVPFVHYKYSVFLFFSLLPIFFSVTFSPCPPRGWKICSRVYWSGWGYQAPPPLLKNTAPLALLGPLAGSDKQKRSTHRQHVSGSQIWFYRVIVYVSWSGCDRFAVGAKIIHIWQC